MRTLHWETWLTGDRRSSTLPELPIRVGSARLDQAMSTVMTAVAPWQGGIGTRGLRVGGLVVGLINNVVAFLVALSSTPAACDLLEPAAIAS